MSTKQGRTTWGKRVKSGRGRTKGSNEEPGYPGKTVESQGKTPGKHFGPLQGANVELNEP